MSSTNNFSCNSMTCFAQVIKQTDLGSFQWEIRSVNHRYLEMFFRLPEGFRVIENDLRAQIKKRFNRGKVEVSLKFQPAQGEQNFHVNEALVRQISNAADQVHAVIGPGNSLNPMQILQWPGVLETEETDQEQLSSQALEAFAEALQQAAAMRAREGESLGQHIQQRLDQIGPIVSTVEKLLPQALEAHKANLKEKIAQVVEQVDQDRLEQELVLLAQKADVAEELDRLITHIAEVERTLNLNEPVGRRLDFMMQELNREANTLSSKALITDITQAAVELKVLIEQMREQVQNIE